VPLRLEPLLAAAVKVTVPEPLPEVALAVSQLFVLLTVHPPQVEPALIVTEALPPVLGYDSDVGDTVKTHGAAACETLIDFPATVTVPLRLEPLFAAAVKVTVAEPLPEVALAVNQLFVLLTVHPPHVVPAVIVTEALPPTLG
jgi:hypothetical protein